MNVTTVEWDDTAQHLPPGVNLYGPCLLFDTAHAVATVLGPDDKADGVGVVRVDNDGILHGDAWEARAGCSQSSSQSSTPSFVHSIGSSMLSFRVQVVTVNKKRPCSQLVLLPGSPQQQRDSTSTNLTEPTPAGPKFLVHAMFGRPPNLVTEACGSPDGGTTGNGAYRSLRLDSSAATSTKRKPRR